ncbi:uncharacterized protein LOC141652117 [Silene latifolia]|uniref:uncharacterized protein LOC141652117 n=1 Tax=Silene latifolia TaxID=37657 RepID=UPI003D78636E
MNIRSSETFARIETIELCKSHSGHVLTIIQGCVDGVLLVRTNFSHGKTRVIVIFLWNPTLRKVVDIPFYESLKKPGCDVLLGFGFDSVSNNYKVVALNFNDLKTTVYNFGSRSWSSPKQQRGLIDNNVKFLSISRSLNFEGCVYRLAKGKLIWGENNATHYLCFNLSTEALTCSKLPDIKRDDALMMFSRAPNCKALRRLSVLYDSLALVDYCGDSPFRHILWIRRNDSTTSSGFAWVQLYNLDFNFKSILYLTNNGNLYLESWSGNPKTISVYNLKAGEEKVCSTTSEHINFMDGYLGSLVLYS